MDFIFKDDSLIWRNLSPDESSKYDSFQGAKPPWTPTRVLPWTRCGAQSAPNPQLYHNDLRSFIRCLRQRTTHLILPRALCECQNFLWIRPCFQKDNGLREHRSLLLSHTDRHWGYRRRSLLAEPKIKEPIIMYENLLACLLFLD